MTTDQLCHSRWSQLRTGSLSQPSPGKHPKAIWAWADGAVVGVAGEGTTHKVRWRWAVRGLDKPVSQRCRVVWRK